MMVLPVPVADHISKCIDKLLLTQTLSDENRWFCNVCNAKQNFTLFVEVKKVPISQNLFPLRLYTTIQLSIHFFEVRCSISGFRKFPISNIEIHASGNNRSISELEIIF